MSRKSEDDDLDQFKSIMVKDDMREDFFEALEKTPKSFGEKQIRFNEMDGIHFESPNSNKETRLMQKQASNKSIDDADESFISCNNEF